MARRKKLPEDLVEKKKVFEKVAENLETLPADEFLKENFLPYAWSFTLARALSDVSGLKPVQRRILYTMYKSGLKPSANRSKVATLAGSVLAYHPHGDSSVVDALKNLARPHVFRVPLIDGKGDFGAPGTPGAAGRYIEARLNNAAWLNVEEIDEHAVAMMPNYDNTKEEPQRIPVRWPVSVINGGSGMAVGYASNMPSHNPTEIMEACKALLLHPEMTHEELQNIVTGPDFNMGGTITSTDGVSKYLSTGSGSFKIRGNYEIIQRPRGAWRIEFDEIPFGTYPEKIITQMHDKQTSKNLFQDVAEFKDLSDRKNPIRIVIDTKSNTNYKKVLQELFKHTDLESTFSANMTTIVENHPVQSPMKDLLLDFIQFRKTCVKNKTRYNMGKKKHRSHLVDGLLVVLLDIDKAIAIIRNSEDSAEAKTLLQKQFNIDENQAEYVLSLQLRRLTKMDNVELEKEKKTLIEQINYMEKLLQDEKTLVEYLLKEFDETLTVIGDERKTEINNMSSEELAEQEKMIAKTLREENKNILCYVTRFENGLLLKTEEPFVYSLGEKSLKNGVIKEQFKVKSKEHISLVFDDGYAYSIPLSYLPFNSPIHADNVGVPNHEDTTLVAIAKNTVLKTDIGLVLATELGDVKIVRPELPEKEEFIVYNLNPGDRIVEGMWLGRSLTDSYFVSITNDSQILAYDATSVRPTGVTAGGVKSHKLRSDKEKIISFTWVPKLRESDVFIVSQSQHSLKLTQLAQIPPKGRGSQGVLLHKYKKGETSIQQACTGKNLLISVGEANRSLPLPPLSDRARTGIDFNLHSSFGYSEPIIM